MGEVREPNRQKEGGGRGVSIFFWKRTLIGHIGFTELNLAQRTGCDWLCNVQAACQKFGINLFEGGKLNTKLHIEHFISKEVGGPSHPDNYAIVYGPINSSFKHWCTYAKIAWFGVHVAGEVMKRCPEYMHPLAYGPYDLAGLERSQAAVAKSLINNPTPNIWSAAASA